MSPVTTIPSLFVSWGDLGNEINLRLDIRTWGWSEDLDDVTRKLQEKSEDKSLYIFGMRNNKNTEATVLIFVNAGQCFYLNQFI